MLGWRSSSSGASFSSCRRPYRFPTVHGCGMFTPVNCCACADESLMWGRCPLSSKAPACPKSSRRRPTEERLRCISDVSKCVVGMQFGEPIIAFLLLGLSATAYRSTNSAPVFLTVLLAVILCCCAIWRLLLVEYPDPHGNRLQNSNSNKAIIARYEHLNSEITRYRDLVWKIPGLAWAVYFVLLHNDPTNGGVVGQLPDWYRLLLLFLTAVAATIFVLYCERLTDRNRVLRRWIELRLRVPPPWRHRGREESPSRVGYRFSRGVFLVAIWVPVMTVLRLL